MLIWILIVLCGRVASVPPNKPLICGDDDGDESSTVDQKGIYSNCIQNGTIHLTFDDGPHPILTEPLLDVLAHHRILATFFINGVNYWPHLSDPESIATVRRIVKEGHTIGSHTWSHLSLTYQSLDSILAEMETLSSKILDILGSKSRFMRPPYGDWNDTVRDIVHRGLGYDVVLWAIDPCDYGLDMDYSLSVFKEALEGKIPEMTPGLIALQHDPLPISVEFTSRLIAYIRTTGFRFVDIHECLGLGIESPHSEL